MTQNVTSTKPFFSVVIPLFNKENHIEGTIKSVLTQTFQDFEILVIDDGSTDGGAKIVRSFQEDRIRLIEQVNSGVSVARNRGIKAASADYIVFLDADDLWFAGFLQTIEELIEEYPGAGIYATAYERKISDGEYEPLKILDLKSKKDTGIVENYFKSKTLDSHLIWTSTTCVPRHVFFDNDIWFPPGVRLYEDVYVWGRIALVMELAYSKFVGGVYVLDAENSTRDICRQNITPSDVLMSLKSYEHLTDRTDLKIYLRKYLENHVKHCLRLSCLSGHKVNAVKVMFKYRLTISSFIEVLPRVLVPNFMLPMFRSIKRKMRSSVP